jgi:hypothetical protein
LRLDKLHLKIFLHFLLEGFGKLLMEGGVNSTTLSKPGNLI